MFHELLVALKNEGGKYNDQFLHATLKSHVKSVWKKINVVSEKGQIQRQNMFAPQKGVELSLGLAKYNPQSRVNPVKLCINFTS